MNIATKTLFAAASFALMTSAASALPSAHLGARGAYPLTQATYRIALQTSDGANFVTAVNGGGGPNEPNCQPGTVSLHENATVIGPWETFTLVHNSNGSYSFKTSDGVHYVTAVNGGGIGGPNYAVPYSQLHTNATSVGPDEIFTLISLGNGLYALQTHDGVHYVTAVNYGGCGGPNNVPFHTDATQIGPWEMFRIIAE